MTVRQIDVTAVPAGAFLLDVRRDDEWAAGHATGAEHIEMGEVPSRVGEIPGDEDVYVICKAGGRSQKVAEWLVSQGYERVSNVSGGTGAWAAAGRPMVADAGATPYVL